MAASVLEPRGSKRRDCFHHVKKLYGIRSKAVHGDKTLMNGLPKDWMVPFVSSGTCFFRLPRRT